MDSLSVGMTGHPARMVSGVRLLAQVEVPMAVTTERHVVVDRQADRKPLPAILDNPLVGVGVVVCPVLGIGSAVRARVLACRSTASAHTLVRGAVSDVITTRNEQADVGVTMR